MGFSRSLKEPESVSAKVCLLKHQSPAEVMLTRARSASVASDNTLHATRHVNHGHAATSDSNQTPSRARQIMKAPPCLFAAEVLLSLLPFLFAGPAVAEDWPRWGGPRGDETWRGPRLRENWPAEGLKRLWQRPLGGGYGGVAAVADRVLVLDRQTEPTERERLL